MFAFRRFLITENVRGKTEIKEPSNYISLRDFCFIRIIKLIFSVHYLNSILKTYVSLS